jgi:hypothetical protein
MRISFAMFQIQKSGFNNLYGYSTKIHQIEQFRIK